MFRITYEDNLFIWEEDGKRTVIGDINVLAKDCYFTVFNRYARLNAFISRYIETSKSLELLNVIAFAKILEAFKTNPDERILYIGNDGKRLASICFLAEIISMRSSVEIHHVILQNIADGVLRTYDGLSQKEIQQNTTNFSECKKNSFDIVIFDADFGENPLSNAISYAKSSGIILAFNDADSLYTDKNITNIFTSKAGWYSFNKNDLKASKTIVDIRTHEISKFKKVLENFYDELPYMMPHTFEDYHFMQGIIKILKHLHKEADHALDEHQNEIKNKIGDVLKGVENFQSNFSGKGKLRKNLSELLNLVNASKISQNYDVSPYESNIEIIVKNDFIPKSPWEYNDVRQKMNFYNWYPQEGGIQNDWFYKFIVKNIPNRKKELNFFSCHGDDLRTRFLNVPNKIFYTMEDSFKRFIDISDFCLPSVDLALCYYDNVKNKNYLCFPYWMRGFEPIIDINFIRKQIEEINNSRSKAIKECAMVCGHDMFGSRVTLVKELGDILDIKCAGWFNHNDDSLKTEFNDNKLEYLKNFMFCACPENGSVKDYVTEKIFDAFKSGCIPIYYGAHNEPLPKMINQNAILIWRYGGDNTELKKTIVKLKKDREFYLKFINQEKIKPKMAEYIFERFTKLKEKISELCM